MTTTNKPIEISSTSTNDALIDQLRACKNPEEILKFEKWFNSNIESEKLHKRICGLLKNRSISRALASKWLLTLIEDRDGREHIFDRQLVEGKAIWCETHKQYELIEVKRLQNQTNLIKAHAND